MNRAATLFQRLRYDGRCASHGGPLVIDTTPPRHIDDDVVVRAIVRLRIQLAKASGAK